MRRMPASLPWILPGLFLAAGGAAGAGELDEALHRQPVAGNAVSNYEVCAACHMPEGWGTVDGEIPQIAGQHPNVIIKQLADIRGGNRDNPGMRLFASKEVIGGPQAIADLAAYIAAMPMTPRTGVGPGSDLQHGAVLYREHCVRCHGEYGEGDDARFYPRIQGQHYRYMLRQFKWIRDGRRRNANPEMVRQIADFSERDMKAVIDFASRLRPSPERVAPSVHYSNPDLP